MDNWKAQPPGVRQSGGGALGRSLSIPSFLLSVSSIIQSLPQIPRR